MDIVQEAELLEEALVTSKPTSTTTQRKMLECSLWH